MGGIRVRLICDLVRNYGVDRARRTLDALLEVAPEGNVIGIGIGGSEPGYPPEPFAALYERARHRGLRTTAHAGEAAGANSIWGAIRALGVDRIGHGTRAGEDPVLLEHLGETQLPLEMCPLSNVRTAVVPSLLAHCGCVEGSFRCGPRFYLVVGGGGFLATLAGLLLLVRRPSSTARRRFTSRAAPL